MRGCATGAGSPSRCSTRASSTPCAPTCRTSGMLLRLAKMLAPGMDPKAMARGDPRAPHRGARLRSRGADAPRVRAHVARTSVRRDPGRGDRAVRRARPRHRVHGRHGLRRREGAVRRPSGTASARSSTGSSSAPSTGPAASPPIRTRATTCCSTDGRVAFIDFGMSKRVSREQVDAELEVMRAGIDGESERLRAALVKMGFFPADDEVVTADARAGALRGRRRVVRGRRRVHDRPRLRAPGDDRRGRSPVALLGC